MGTERHGNEGTGRPLAPVHPGEVLREEFLKPLGLSGNRLALSIAVDPGRINQILHGKRGISPETALRLARFFGNSPEFWMGLQTRYDLDVAEQTVGERVRREVRPLAQQPSHKEVRDVGVRGHSHTEG